MTTRLEGTDTERMCVLSAKPRINAGLFRGWPCSAFWPNAVQLFRGCRGGLRGHSSSADEPARSGPGGHLKISNSQQAFAAAERRNFSTGKLAGKSDFQKKSRYIECLGESGFIESFAGSLAVRGH
jgi:hypothetical protein